MEFTERTFEYSQKLLRMKKSLLLSIFCLFALVSKAQETGFQHICAHHNHEGVEDHFQIPVFTLKFSSQSEAQAVLNDILSYVGLRANYIIQPAGVPNAAAVIQNQQRYILYNQKFIQSVKKDTRTNWSAVSILAHEIGHHLNGHTIQSGGNWHKMELESDEFSGFILRKMGASLEDAQSAMKLLASANGSMTHPGKADRLKAIERGWMQADEMLSDYASTTDQPTIEPEVQAEKPSRPRSRRQKPRTERSESDMEPMSTDQTDVVERIEEPSEADIMEEVPQQHPSFAKWKVTLVKNPNSSYYITKSNQFVVMKGEQIIAIGKFKRTKSTDFPFMIRFNGGKSPDLMVNPNGELISAQGNTIGFILKV